jgi:type II secretory pathway pseudopilin PulG
MAAVRRGITMMEVVIGTLLVGMVLAATLNLIGPTVRATKLAGDEVLAAQFVEELLAEIAAQPYRDPKDDAGVIGPETGETGSDRSRFDDVDDYNGWKDSIQTATGVARGGLTGSWARAAKVIWIDPDDPATEVGADLGAKRVTVSVSLGGTRLATQTIIRTEGFDESREID